MTAIETPVVPPQPSPITYVPPPVPGSLIAAAIVQVQGAISSVGKSREVEVVPKDGSRSYKFKYATLSAIWDVIRKPCADAGLAIIQTPRIDVPKMMVSVETRIVHVSGEFISATIDLPTKRTDPQGLGAVISYGRRYGVSCLLGVTQDDENDEQALEDFDGPPKTETQRAPVAQSKPVAAAPKAAPPADPNAPPVSEAEFEQNLRSCTTKAELAKVSLRVKTAYDSKQIDADARKRLVEVYKEEDKRLSEGGAK